MILFARHCKHLKTLNIISFDMKKLERSFSELIYKMQIYFWKEKKWYIRVIDKFQGNFLDFIIVDGKYLDDCVLRIIIKIASRDLALGQHGKPLSLKF